MLVLLMTESKVLPKRSSNDMLFIQFYENGANSF